MPSDLAGIALLAMVVMRGVSKGARGKEMVTGTAAVDTAMSTYFLSAGMGFASDIDAVLGAAVMLTGRGGVMGLVRCSFLLYHVSYFGQWHRLWDATYKNVTNPGKRRVLPSLQDHMVHVPHWARLIDHCMHHSKTLHECL